MLRNRITLLATCLALFIVTVCGNQPINSAANAAGRICTNSLSSTLGTPLPESSPKTVRVRLTEVETNADVVDWPYPDSEIIIKTGATTLNKKTDNNGVALFEAVPCGQQIVITRKDADGGEDGVFHRSLPCARRQVDLGIIERAFGGKYTLKQRKLQRMGYDATRNVWRNANGRIISMRTFNRIMSQRH